jgi:phage-related protein
MPHPHEHVVDPLRHPYTIEFYADPETGREHVREWIKEDLTPFQRRSIGIAMSEILEVNGINVCDTEYGKNLGQGLFEFRLRHGADEVAAMFTTRTPDERDKEPILLRVYCHAYGDKIVLLLAGYDKQADAGKKRENQEIMLARKRLTEFKQQRRLKRLRRPRTIRKAGR